MPPITQDNPLIALVNMASGLWVSRALWAAAKLKIADAVDEEPVAVEDIAARSGTHSDNLGRLLNVLAAAGVFARTQDGRFEHSDMSRVLRSDHPLSQQAFIEAVFGGEHYAAWGALDTSIRTGTTAFDSLYGMPVFDWYSRQGAEAELFSRAMESTTKLLEMALLASWNPPAFTRAVDVGGSRGTLVAALLDRQPQARGILFDLPDIVAAVTPALTNDRIEAIGGNFFESVPEGDLYLLKLILHDWTDAQSQTILTNIRAAIRPGGRVAIIENLLPDTLEPHPGFMMDLNMMVMTGGRERSVSDFEALLQRTGFEVESITATPTPMGVVQAVAV